MITLAQAGLGRWGQNHFRVFSGMKDCRMKMCCDRDKAALDRVGNDKVIKTSDYSDIVKDSEIDAVVISTPSETHAELALKALSSGKHVFVEKPLALKVKDAEEMLKAAEKNKKILMVGHLLLYHPAVEKIRSYVEKGELGDLLYLYSTRVNLGQVRAEENALWSLTAHDISVAIYLTGKMPVEVSTTGKCYIRDYVQDVVFVSMGFGDKLMAHIHASWLDPHKIRQFTVVGTKKMVVFDDVEATEKIRVYDKGVDWSKNCGSYDAFLTVRQGDIYVPRVDMVEPLKVECKHFVDCIKEGKKPLTDGENGLKVLKVLAAAQESLEQDGRPVKIGKEEIFCPLVFVCRQRSKHRSGHEDMALLSCACGLSHRKELQDRPECCDRPGCGNRRQRQGPEQRIGLQGSGTRGRRFLRSVMRIHKCI
jgi:predicted dehydrogenase